MLSVLFAEFLVSPSDAPRRIAAATFSQPTLLYTVVIDDGALPGKSLGMDFPTLDVNRIY